MTMAVIVACKDSFYIVCDTLSGGDNCFSLNTKKSFFSEKHKVGMCIAGEAILKFPELYRIEDVLYTDFVINEFFGWIETLSTFRVEDMQGTLQAFFEERYPRYWSWFQQGVSYFYGGFVNKDGMTITAIYCHHIHCDDSDRPVVIEERQYLFSDTDSITPCFFACTNAVQSRLDWTLSLPGTPADMTPKRFLTEETNGSKCRSMFLKFTIPHACLTVNSEAPYYIGDYLHYVMMRSNGDVIHRGFKVVEGDSCTPGCPVALSDMPPCLLYRSCKESNRAFLNGKFFQYSIKTGERVSNALYAAIKIQSVFRGFLARAEARGIRNEQEADYTKGMGI